MAGKTMTATISLVGKVDPSLAKALKDVQKQFQGAVKGMSVSKSFWSGLGKAGAVAAKGIAAAGTAAATAVGAVGGAALQQYATYEQVVGGVDTLFKDASSQVQQYASAAYKTAGVSANAYMQQATMMSASLVQGLGGDTQEAAKMVDLAIKDMADNSNKFGSDLGSIQQTYQSLMRGNYAMLDNLRLGYGGTKSELERLVKDASKLTGEALDPAKFSDVIKAIHAVQENMGVTGTTAKEAATTIEGSVNTMKAAWSNWLTGLGTDGADMGALTDQLLTSIGNVAGNIGPVVQRIGASLSEALPQAIAGAASTLAPLIAETLSGVINSAASALNIELPGFNADAIMGIFNQVGPAIQSLVSAVGPSIQNFVNAVLPPLMSALQSLMPFLSAIASTILPPIINFLTPIASTIMNIAAAVLPLLTAAIQALSPFLQVLISLVLTLTPIVSGAYSVFQLVTGPIRTLGASLIPALNTAWQSMQGPITSVMGFMSSLWGAIQPVVSILGSLVSLVGQAAAGLASLAGGAIGAIGGLFGFRKGGFTTGPYIAGEDPRYPNEAVISFNPAYRAQNLRYWAMAGHMLGASPSVQAATATGGGATYDFSGMTFAPNVTVEGNADKADIIAAIKECEGEFIDLVTELLESRREAAYV